MKNVKNHIPLKQSVVSLWSTVLLFGCVHTTALMNSWPDQRGTQNGGRSYNNAPVRNATIVLNDGTKLNGEVKFVPFPRSYVNNTTYIFLLPIGEKKKQDVRLIEGDSIRLVRVYPDSLNDLSYYADYYRFRNKNYDVFMWYLAQNEEMGIAMQDVEFSADTTNPHSFFISLIDLKQSNLIKLNQLPFFLSRQNLQKELLKIINRRYLQHFNQEDFKDTHAMADYILDEESKRR